MTKQQMIDELQKRIAELEAEIEALRIKHSRKGRAGRKRLTDAPLTGAERAARYRERKKKSNENENSD